MKLLLANSLTNYIIVRAHNLHFSFLIGCFFPVLGGFLFICVIQLDAAATWSLLPYLLYRVYGAWWGYALWKLNVGRPGDEFTNKRDG